MLAQFKACCTAADIHHDHRHRAAVHIALVIAFAGIFRRIHRQFAREVLPLDIEFAEHRPVAAAKHPLHCAGLQHIHDDDFGVTCFGLERCVNERIEPILRELRLLRSIYSNAARARLKAFPLNADLVHIRKNHGSAHQKRDAECCFHGNRPGFTTQSGGRGSNLLEKEILIHFTPLHFLQSAGSRR